MPISTERSDERRPFRPRRKTTASRRSGTIPKTDDAVKMLADRTGDDRKLRQMIEREKLNARIARMIYDARTKAGLTQKQLADLAGTRQPNIARLEDADYRGHSLAMLHRIARALDLEIE